jgi:hypothetical protein
MIHGKLQTNAGLHISRPFQLKCRCIMHDPPVTLNNHRVWLAELSGHTREHDCETGKELRMHAATVSRLGTPVVYKNTVYRHSTNSIDDSKIDLYFHISWTFYFIIIYKLFVTASSHVTKRIYCKVLSSNKCAFYIKNFHLKFAFWSTTNGLNSLAILFHLKSICKWF